MIHLTLDDRAVQQALDNLSRRLSDMSPVMNRVAQVMEEGTRKHFEEERGPDGQKWKPLADSTLLAYMRRASPGGLLTKRGNTRAKAIKALAQKKILRDSGDLSHLLGRQVTASSAQLSSNMKYAATHQFGDDKRNIPARPFFGFSEAITAGIVAAAQDYITEALP